MAKAFFNVPPKPRELVHRITLHLTEAEAEVLRALTGDSSATALESVFAQNGRRKAAAVVAAQQLPGLGGGTDPLYTVYVALNNILGG